MTFGQDKRILLPRRAYRPRLTPERYPAFEAALISGRKPEAPMERASCEGRVSKVFSRREARGL